MFFSPPKVKICVAGDLNDLSEEMKNLLGYSDLNPDKGFMGAGGILQWGPDYGYQYNSIEDCRGMDCQVYETCIKVDDTDNRVYIVYYWSGEWPTYLLIYFIFKLISNNRVCIMWYWSGEWPAPLFIFYFDLFVYLFFYLFIFFLSNHVKNIVNFNYFSCWSLPSFSEYDFLSFWYGMSFCICLGQQMIVSAIY